MALFTFQCEDCQAVSEILVRGSETPACPQCGSTMLEKQASAFAAVMGGSQATEPAPCGVPGGCPGGSCPYSN